MKESFFSGMAKHLKRQSTLASIQQIARAYFGFVLHIKAECAQFSEM